MATVTLFRANNQTPGRVRPWLAVIALISCGLFPARAQQAGMAAGKRAPSVYTALEEAPDSASMRRNPFEGNAREAIAGGKLFEQHCAECHGEKAGGTKRGPSLLRPEVQQATPGTIFWVLTNGVVWQGMPVWSKLPEPERWQIVTFLKSLGRSSAEPAHN